MEMKRLLVILIVMAAGLVSNAERMKGKVVRNTDRKPVGHAILQVEYVDTIISYEADRKGRFSIEPLSFPITVTVRGSGMLDATLGLMSMPDSGLTVELTPDGNGGKASARRKPDWTSASKRRLSSTYIVRTPAR